MIRYSKMRRVCEQYIKSSLNYPFRTRYYSNFGQQAVGGFCGSVGCTKLIHFSKLSAETGCNIYGKAEFLNPGGSVKDRTALALIEDAESKGIISAGDTIVEGTAGNTGIGLAHICRAKGYKCLIYIPETQSKEKMDYLKMLGAEVKAVPAVPYSDPNNFNHLARRYAEENENAYWTDQFDNVANRHQHYLTTGQEIWSQVDGKIDAFTCATGSGGTLAGVSQFLKEKNENIKIYLADPPGSVLHSWVQRGVLERQGTSITEGIGQGRVTTNLSNTKIDGSFCIPDRLTINMLYRLLYEDGFLFGPSSCMNVVAARELARELGPGNNIVTIICDDGLRYCSRLFSESWLQSKGLIDYIDAKHQHLISLP